MKIEKELEEIHKWIEKIQKSEVNKKKLIKISEELKSKKISFEMSAKKIINIRKNELVFKKNHTNNKELLNYFSRIITVINERRWLDKHYDYELEPINKSIRQEEKKYGLKDDESFSIYNQPKEIEALNKKYNQVLKKKRGEVLKEFIPEEIFSYFLKEFKTIEKEEEVSLERIRKREKICKKKEKSYEIILMEKYYNEFLLCRKNKIYTAAIVMLGAAFECLLIHKASKDKEKLDIAIKKLYKEKEIKKNKLYNLDLSELIKVSVSMGYIKEVEYKEKILFLDKRAQNIREARNIIHPGKILRNGNINIFIIEKEDITLLNSIFQLIKKSK